MIHIINTEGGSGYSVKIQRDTKCHYCKRGKTKNIVFQNMEVSLCLFCVMYFFLCDEGNIIHEDVTITSEKILAIKEILK